MAQPAQYRRKVRRQAPRKLRKTIGKDDNRVSRRARYTTIEPQSDWEPRKSFGSMDEAIVAFEILEKAGKDFIIRQEDTNVWTLVMPPIPPDPEPKGDDD